MPKEKNYAIPNIKQISTSNMDNYKQNMEKYKQQQSSFHPSNLFPKAKEFEFKCGTNRLRYVGS